MFLMKKIFRASGIILIIILILSCKKNEKPASLPVVSTTSVTEILYATASSGGTVTDDGPAPIVTRGVCW